MDAKRITLFVGHYGSGKTNIAVNYALRLAEAGRRVALADLDIVNPYFRSKDSLDDLTAAGVRLIASPYAGSNLDLPALPQEMYAVTDDKTLSAILDVGGDDRGALALGRLTPAILEENDFECLAVINRYRPLTGTPEETVGVLREIEGAGGVPITGLVNNSNLGRETTPDDVLLSVAYAEEVSRLTGLPVRMTTVEWGVYPLLSGKIPDLFPLDLQKKIE